MCAGIHKVIVWIVQVYLLLLFELTIRNILRCANKWHLRCNNFRLKQFHCYHIIIICLGETEQQLVECTCLIGFVSRKFLPFTQFQLSTWKLHCVLNLQLQFLELKLVYRKFARTDTDTCTSTTMMWFWFIVHSRMQSSHKMNVQITQVPNSIDSIIKWMIQLWMESVISIKRCKIIWPTHWAFSCGRLVFWYIQYFEEVWGKCWNIKWYLYYVVEQ